MKKIKLRNDKVLILREGEQSDAAEMINYLHKIGGESDFLTFGEGEFKTDMKKQGNFIEEIKKKENGIFIIAEVDEKIVGNINFSGGHRPRIAHTGKMGISVLKDYWGLGIGEHLIRYLIQWAENSNVIKKIDLKVRTDNERGIKLYKKLGFKPVGVISRTMVIGNIYYNSLYMQLDIN